MKFDVNRDALLSELAFVKGATEQKQTIPALSYVLAEAEGGRVKLTGTDLDVTAFTEVAADVVTPGAVCLPARKLYDIAKSLTGETVTFEAQDNGRTAVTSGRSAFRLAGIDRDSFAQVPTGAPKGVALPAPVFREVVEQTSYAIRTEDHGYQMQGLMLTLDKAGLKAIAVDGHRLAKLERPELGASVNGTSFDRLIPRKSLGLAASFIASGDGEILLASDENHVYFTSGARLLVGRLLTGNFPDTNMMIPKTAEGRAEFDAGELSKAVRRAQLVADSDFAGHSVILRFAPGSVTVLAETREVGDAEEQLGVDYEGAEQDFIFTGSYLLDVLKSAGDRRVAMEFRDTKSQIIFRPVGAEFSKLDLIVPRQR